MGALLDAIQAEKVNRGGRLNQIDVMFTQFSGEEYDDLMTAFHDKSITSIVLMRALAKQGITVQISAVKRWRIREGITTK